MDKTPREVVYDVMLKQNFQDAILDECEEISAAVIAHVTPQIRSAAIEDEFRMLCLFALDPENAMTSDMLVKFREFIKGLATLPPGHVCVTIDVFDECVKFIEYWGPKDGSEDGSEDAFELHDELVKIIAAAKEPK